MKESDFIIFCGIDMLLGVSVARAFLELSEIKIQGMIHIYSRAYYHGSRCRVYGLSQNEQLDMAFGGVMVIFGATDL
jgi:hypothetical protein